MSDQDPKPINPDYRNARFRYEPPMGGLPECFAVITACNPDGEKISDEENAERTDGLRLQLVKLGHVHFPVIGYDPDPAQDPPHEEAGFGVVCDWEAACGLGDGYAQEAIFWVESGRVSLVNLRTGARPMREFLRPLVEMADGRQIGDAGRQ